MTQAEFKAWFEGFTEALAGVPTKAQWARIKARVDEIDGKTVTERVFVDRYWPTYIYSSQIVPYSPYRHPVWATTFCANSQTPTSTGQGLSNGGNVAVCFNSSQAMLALGRAEATQ